MNWDKVESYNVVYTVPGKTDRSAMPIGNGELCASVWTTEDGHIKFYFGRTDCLGENDVTMKLGMMDIQTVPNFLSEGGYRQTLILEEGRIEIESNLGRISIFMPHTNHTIYVTGTYTKNVETIAKYHTWRTKDAENAFSPWPVSITRTADVVETGHSVCFYHQNGENGIKELALLQGIEDTSVIPDFLTGRIFGGSIALQNGVSYENGLKCNGKEAELTITTLSGQYENVTEWKKELSKAEKENLSAEEALKVTSEKWKAFWKKSYIFISGDKPRNVSCTEEVIKRSEEVLECNDAPSRVTRAYLLTKFMFACCKDGNFPMFYNGLLFNLTPGNGEHLAVPTFSGTFTSQPLEDANEEFNPDERSWSIEHLWQNLRLPYYTMLHTGDFDSLKKMFRYYLRFQKLNEQRAKAYYGADGIHNTEMTLSCGLPSADIYGRDRNGMRPGDAANEWGGSIQISPGLELLNLMLEYCSYTDDIEFLRTDVVGFARKTFACLETRFGRNADGKLNMEDINCVETYFHTTNPVPVVAGMHCDLDKLITADILQEDKEYFEYILTITPEIPKGIVDGKELILPAEQYEDVRKNIELPELYTVYPFGLFQIVKGNEEIAVDTFHDIVNRHGLMQPHTIGMPPGTPGYSGWHYIGNAAAMLGLTDICEEILENNAALLNPGNRFPAMWGPVHDAVPDVDHGANIMNLLQLMVLQCAENEIKVLPAFPTHWNVKCRLYAPHNTVVECEYSDGKITLCNIAPCR